MSLPRIPVVGTRRQDAWWNKYRSIPLSTSYPAANFRANRTTPDAPGNPNFGGVTSPTAGDPRALVGGGYYGVYAGQAAASMFALLGGPRQSFRGGDQVNSSSPLASIPWIPVIIGATVLYFFLRK